MVTVTASAKFRFYQSVFRNRASASQSVSQTFSTPKRLDLSTGRRRRRRGFDFFVPSLPLPPSLLPSISAATGDGAMEGRKGRAEEDGRREGGSYGGKTLVAKAFVPATHLT